MRKARRLIPLVILLVLTGCTTTDRQVLFERWIMDHAVSASNIIEDEDYVRYLEWQEDGKLDEAGYYNDYGEYAEDFSAEGVLFGEIEQSSTEQKQVHVTFANNTYLSIDYFYDENRENPIDSPDCFLDCGESIYASQPQCSNPYTNAYVFTGYRIYEYDAVGNRGKEPIYETGIVDKVFTVPDDFRGTELSVEPVGKYQKREVSFKAYIVDKDGHKTVFSFGTWEVDGKEYKEDMAQLDPSAAYTVKYCFEASEYYVYDSNPEPYSINNGEVIFPKATPMDTNDSYEVQLHPYLSAVLEENIKYIESIEVNGTIYKDDLQAKNQAEVKKLKIGDKVSIVTTEGYRLFCSQFPLDEPEKLDDNKFRYHFSVPDINEEIGIRVSKSTFTVSIASNVGNNVSFNIKTSGFQKSNLVYEKELFNRSHEVVNDTIGAEKSVMISAQGSALPENHVLRLYIEKTDNNGNITKETKYISSLPGDQIIDIYESGVAANVSKVYKEVNIEINLVEAVQYKKEAVDNGTIELYFMDVNADKELQDGDYLEDSTKVRVVLRPLDDYYVSGRKVADDNCYREEMKYKDYNFAEIMEEHPIKKFIVVTLDDSDEYGTCVYKIGKEEVSGERELREGQTLTLEYTLTDPDYKVVRESEGFWGGIKSWSADTLSKNTEIVEIVITPELDGTVITRDSYIKVDKK